MIHRKPAMFSIGAILVAIVSIQTGASLAKGIFPVVGAQGATALRLAFAAAILCALRRPWRSGVSRRELPAVLAYGTSLGTMNLLFYMALERIPLGIAVALEFTGPLSLALLASRKALDFAWAMLATAGILLVLPLSRTSPALDPLGIVLALAAGAGWAMYIVFGRKAGAATHAGVVTSLGMVVASIIAVPFGAAQAGSALLEPGVLPVALGVAVLSSALPYTLEMMALRNIPAKNFGILMSLEPAVAALSGLMILGERLAPVQWAAIACIILASAGSAASIPAPAKAGAAA